MDILVAILLFLSGPGKPDIHNEYYANGNPKITYVVEGSDITVLQYYPNGVLRERGTFRGVDRHGSWMSYNQFGELEGRAEYTAGERSGTWQLWYSNGQLMSETRYQNGNAIQHQMWDAGGAPLSYAH